MDGGREKVYFDFNWWSSRWQASRRTARGRRARQAHHALYSSVVHFLGSILIEKVHPLECGIVRRKIRTQRRPGMKIENPLLFYPRRVAESLTSGVRWAQLFLKFCPARSASKPMRARGHIPTLPCQLRAMRN